MSEMTIVLQRLDKMQESIDSLRGELRGEMQKNNKSLRAEMQEMKAELRGEMQEMKNELRGEMQEMKNELSQRMDIMEYGLGHEIQAVYEIARQNAEDIRLLMSYKSKLINVCTMSDRVEHLEECQKVTTGVVASHSEAIRKLESRLA